MFDRPPQKINPTEKSTETKKLKRESLFINGTQVDTVDIKPENQKDEVPVLVAPGWGATIESFEPGIKVLNDRGRRAICLDHPRKGGIMPESHNQEVEQWYKNRGQKYPDWSTEELRKANTILGLLDQKKLDKVDVVAHSEGSINVCIAAMLHPEKFRSLVLYNPAGLIGKDNIFRLQKGAGANTSRTETVSHIPITEAETEYLASTTHITPDYMKEAPIRALKEVWAISQARIEDMLRYIHEKGIKIVIIGAVEDTMFPMIGMQNNVKKDFIDGFLSVKGGHMQIQVHPELFMGAAESMLAQLEENRKKENKN
jgi:pimeloyl-ACP methyl ester carboxylesterase